MIKLFTESIFCHILLRLGIILKKAIGGSIIQLDSRIHLDLALMQKHEDYTALSNSEDLKDIQRFRLWDRVFEGLHQVDSLAVKIYNGVR